MNNDGPSKMLISKLLSPASVELKLSGQQRDEVLGELVRHIPEIADQPEAQQRLLRALQEREQLHTTAIGDGIALPHARNALVGLVEQPVIVFGRHDQGLPYGTSMASRRGSSFCWSPQTSPSTSRYWRVSAACCGIRGCARASW